MNCYFLAYCSESSRRATLSAAKRMGANAIRAWAFLDTSTPEPGRVAFQYFENGAIAINDGPDGLERLDALLAAAEEFGVSLILPLVNHWPDFGGMATYLEWLGAANFYSAPEARRAYRNWMEHVLTRCNTITGRLYSDEPGVLAWELANEPRSPGPGGRDLLLDWTAEMSAFAKQLDANHLIALGDEGFFYRRGRGHLYDGTYGVDFEATLALDTIDFGAYHFYPQQWGLRGNLDFAEEWIADHIAAGERAGKPVLLEEYGLKIDGCYVRSPGEREERLAHWLQLATQNGGAGALRWMLGCGEPDTCGYRDDYTIYPTFD